MWPPQSGVAPHHPYPDLQITWQIRDASGSTLLEHEVSCSVAANSLTKAAEVAWTIPQAPDARYRITFELADATGTLSSNEYRIAVQGKSPISPGAAGFRPRIHRRAVRRRPIPDALLDLLRLTE